MSRVLKDFHSSIVKSKAYNKFFMQHNAGNRIFPSKTAKNDEALQLRYDAGEVVNGKKKINLQINSQAKSEALKKFIGNKKGTHATVASAEIDVNTPEDRQEAEIAKMFKAIDSQFKSKVG